jgi:hypothetical protein
MVHVSETSGSGYRGQATRCDNGTLKLAVYIDGCDSEMKTGHYSVTTRPEKVTTRANRSDAVSPNLSPTTVSSHVHNSAVVPLIL